MKSFEIAQNMEIPVLTVPAGDTGYEVRPSPITTTSWYLMDSLLIAS
jgi:hypothetical protein